MNNDQWFQPGDKVMRVPDKWEPPPWVTFYKEDPEPEVGRVYCVSEFTNRTTVNMVALVGYPSTGDYGLGFRGWPARYFRKVEEIRLCIEAVKKAKAPTEAPRVKEPTK